MSIPTRGDAVQKWKEGLDSSRPACQKHVMKSLSWCLYLGFILAASACSTPPPPNPELVAQHRAKQELNLLNARLVRAYQVRDQATKRLGAIQAQLRQSGLTAKERANYQLDLDEAQAQLQEASERVTALEAELRQDWKKYTARYGMGPRVSDPCRDAAGGKPGACKE